MIICTFLLKFSNIEREIIVLFTLTVIQAITGTGITDDNIFSLIPMMSAFDSANNMFCLYAHTLPFNFPSLNLHLINTKMFSMHVTQLK